jgi:signal transduction histidine kinase
MRSDRKRRLSLRERVSLALVSLVAVFVFALGTLAVLSLGEQEDDLADEWVLAEARRLAAHAERGDLHNPGNVELFTPTSTLRAWLRAPDGTVRPGPLPGYLEGMGEGIHWRSFATAELHIAVIGTGRGRLYVQYDASANEAKVRRFALYLSLLGLLCVAVAFVVSRRVASVVVGPIERLTGQLSDWAPQAAVAQTAGSDEEQRLFDAFQRVQGRLERVIAREREFVANVRHEIRTPLTALRTDLELLALADDGADPARAARLQRTLSMVDAVDAALESAHVVSRRGPLLPQPVALASCVDDAWASLQADVGIDGLRFVNTVAADVVVEADRHALLTILRNLIRNSAEHAAPARCVVSYRDDCIEVADDGPGIPAEDLPLVFERYYRGRYNDAAGIEASERGIGLAIARQVADLNGWSLSAHSRPGGGARFVLRLLAPATAAG